MNDEVAGGDLDDLRRAANALTDVAGVYSNYAFILGLRPDVDTEKYGRGHEWWTYVADQLTTALRYSYDRMQDGNKGLLSAIDAYKYTDEENSKDLTEAGKDYEDWISDPDKVEGDPISKLPVSLHTWVDEPDLDDKPKGWEKDDG